MSLKICKSILFIPKKPAFLHLLPQFRAFIGREGFSTIFKPDLACKTGIGTVELSGDFNKFFI